MTPSETLEYGPIIIGLMGGLALFLYGMDQMTIALKRVAGAGLKTALSRMTRNRFTAVGAGALITAIIQSSSVTTVLLVGFVSAGLLTLPQSIGVILGADIGTTVTAQIVAFKVTGYGLVLVAVGFLASVVAKRERLRQYGAALLGLGLIFVGMELMSEATNPLRSHTAFISALEGAEAPLVGILFGALFTAIVQSSSATMGVVIVLAGQGFLTLEAGIALVFGANVGTCVTALLAAIGKPRDAVRVAVAHVGFKIIGVAVWFAFIPELASAVRWMSPESSEALTGAARLALDTPRQIANAHTLFNVANTLLFLPFVGAAVWVVVRLVPEGSKTPAPGVRPRYLDELLTDTPALALDRVRMELRRLGERAYEMVHRSLRVTLAGSAEDVRALEKLDEEVDQLHGAIVEYLGKTAQGTLDESMAAQHEAYLDAANRMESIGDLVETNLVGAGLARLEAGIQVSAETTEHLSALHARVCWAVQTAFEALDAADPDIARLVTGSKAEIKGLAREARTHLAGRLTVPGPDRLTLYRMETEVIEYLQRVYTYARGIAKTVERRTRASREEAERARSTAAAL